MTSVLPSDADLVRRCMAGDRPAFGEIVARYEGLVRALAYSACGDRARSEDIAQEAFVTAWQRLGDLRDAGKFRPWLCSITRRAARLALRHVSRRPEGFAAGLDELPEAPDAAPRPDQILTLREEEQLVWEMIERLPQQCREVLVLFYREEHSAERIAEELGISGQAVRQRLSRGRTMLCGRLAHLVEFSLRRGGRPGGELAAATLAALPALPAAMPAPAQAAGTFTSLSTYIAAMTKTQAAAAGIVLAALAGAPFIVQQHKTIATLRAQVSAKGAAQDTSRTARGRVAGRTDAGPVNWPRSLNDLRLLLRDYPSRGHTAALWRMAERIPPADLERLALEALKVPRADWRDKEIAALLLERMAQLDPAAAAALIAQLEGEASIVTLAQFAAIAPAEAVPLLESLPGADLSRVLNDAVALGRIAAHDPAATALLLASVPMTSDAAPKHARLAQIWAASDPKKALAWAESLDFEQVRTQALMALYPQWAKHDRESAFTALDRVPDDSLRRNLFDEMAWEVISSDLPNAEKWVRGLEGDQQPYALGLLGARVAASDPARATALLREAVDSGYPYLTWPSHEIAMAYAQRDPAAAGRWAMTLPEGEIRKHGAEGVARAWVSADPVAASAWIATLPPGDARNGATYFLVEGIMGTDPASAFHWAASVTDDPEKRLYLLQRSVDSWTRSSPEAVRAAIEQLPIADNERESLLKRL